ncbi:hypothetical protein [Qipengyuania flava]|uniref:hypothetical protein n=1 Tax=Qipengyuania flava TaxID=192812 RepID=UPI001C636CBB|nr:hypothetical protein [Qipengyuania flava]QYJ06561.1 hypothetical protein KUV82_10860 [Qipengyuania flava]
MFRWHEASTNLDLDQVGPFFEHLNAALGSGFDTATLTRFAETTEVEDERAMKTQATFEGRKHTVRFEVFMDNIAAPDIALFTRKAAFAEAIQSEIIAFCDALGI